MLPLAVQRAFVPACLALGTLLFALPVCADTPPAPAVVSSAAQMITLQHVLPADIVKSMRWDLPSKLPVGVSQVQAVPAQNALAVTATNAGLDAVRRIVKILDTEPRQVLIRFAAASVPETDLASSGVDFALVPLAASDLKRGFIRYGGGSAAVRFLQTLTRKGAVTEEPDMTTSSNMEASFSTATVPPVVTQQIRVTPRVNADNAVTLDLHAVFSEGAEKQTADVLRTVKRGETMILVMPPAVAGRQSLLLFATPTVK